MIVLREPIWLLLALPLVAAWLRFPPPTPWLRGLRILLMTILLASMAHPLIRTPVPSGTVVVLADRSASMPMDALQRQVEMLRLLRQGMEARHRLAVLSFSERVALEQPPANTAFAGFLQDTGRDQSHLDQAIDKALTLLPGNRSGRILVLSDGLYTGREPYATAARAAHRGISIDFRLQQRPAAGDLAVREIQAPTRVAEGQAYLITAWVNSPVRQVIRYELRRGREIVASGQREIGSGLSKLVFRDRPSGAGAAQYALRIDGAGTDPVPANNQARFMVGIEGRMPLLCISASDGLTRVLRKAGMEVTRQTPDEARLSLGDLAHYAVVVLENVRADQLSGAELESLSAWVEQTGAGLLITGGKRSYGVGGYYQSPLERIMPVSMELRREHRKLSMAMVLALDRSGSMSANAGRGMTKMDLANIGAAQVYDLLAPTDELGVIAIDNRPHTVLDLDFVEPSSNRRGKILRIEAMGGGIFVYEALSAAVRMAARSKSGTRHIILFADAADAEEPGQYKALIEHCNKAGITISVVGLGLPTDVDADLLEDIAYRGKGDIYFTDNPHDIPRLFAQDTFAVARSTFIEQATPFQWTGGLRTLMGGKTFPPPPALGGYNLCYLRQGALAAAVSTDDNRAPIVAAWQAGLGRVLCYMGEADGAFTGALAGWPETGAFLASLVGWTAGGGAELGREMLLTQELRDGAARITLHLDPERENDPFAGAPTVSILRGAPGAEPTRQRARLRRENADELVLDLPLNGSEIMLASVVIPGREAMTLSPVCLPYSPEFAPREADQGRVALERIAEISGGREIGNLPGIWETLPRTVRRTDLTPWLAILAMLVFLLEIAQRRTSLLSRHHTMKTQTEPNKDSGVKPAKAQAASTGQEKNSTFDAMRQARRNARRRR